MAPVVWLGRDGNEIETVVAVLMSRRHQTAERIRASVGDGGIDIQVPNERGWDIYQVKGFHSNLTTSQKTQIKKSFNRLLKYSKSVGMTVTSWYLVMPLDPTKENKTWLKGITKDATFPCHWPGKIFVDGLAAEFPDVIDYYWGNGKDRVLETIRQIATTTDLIKRGSDPLAPEPLTPAEVQDGLVSLFEVLNKFDPHYKYGYAVTPEMPTPSTAPNLILQATDGREGCFVTFYVFPKHPPVVDEEMPTIRTLFRVQTNSANHRAVEEFLRYGAPLTLPLGTVSADANLPGGLGGKFEGGSITIGPTAEQLAEPDQVLRMQVLNPGSEVIAETILRQRPGTVGANGTGSRSVAVEQGGCFTLEMLLDFEEQSMTWRLRDFVLAGKPPAEVLPGLHVLAALRPPNTVRIGPQYGLIDTPAVEVPDDLAVTLPPGLVDYVEAIEVIQQYTATQLKIPDGPQIASDEALEIRLSAAILRGEQPALRFSRYECPLTAAPHLEGNGPHNIAVWMPHTVTVNAVTVDLGQRRFFAHQVEVELTPLAEGGTQMVLTPHEGDTFVMQFTSGEEPQPPRLE